jgi:hypothetical protein
MRIISPYVVAATAFITLNEYSICNRRLEHYVNRVRNLSKGKYYISAFDSSMLPYQFSFIFQSDETRMYTVVTPELRKQKILRGYFIIHLPKGFEEILVEAAKDSPKKDDLANANVLTKEKKQKNRGKK